VKNSAHYHVLRVLAEEGAIPLIVLVRQLAEPGYGTEAVRHTVRVLQRAGYVRYSDVSITTEGLRALDASIDMEQRAM
jgi:predicted transcriptional regulator